MLENPSAENSDPKRKKASSKTRALLGAALIAGVGVSDAYAEQDNGNPEDWKAMYDALTPGTRTSIETVRRLREQAEPHRRVQIELNGEIVYEKNYGTIPEDPDPNRMKKP